MGWISIHYCGICGNITDKTPAKVKLILTKDNSNTTLWNKFCCESCLKEIKENEKRVDMLEREFEKSMKKKLRAEVGKLIKENKDGLKLDKSILYGLKPNKNTAEKLLKAGAIKAEEYTNIMKEEGK